MIDEDELRAILAADAERYDVPAAGQDQIRAAVRGDSGTLGTEPLPSVSWARGSKRITGRRPVNLALAGIAAAVVLALLIGNMGGNDARSGRRGDTASNDSSAGSASPGRQQARRTSPRGAPLPTTVPSRAAKSPPAGGGAKQRPAAANRGGSEKIIKTGSIELTVARRTFSERAARLTSLAKGFGGFVAETSTSEQGTSPSGTVTLRVPADRFEELLVQVRRLGKVRSATTGAQDVTTEYTDVTGRLKTMKNERDQLNVVLSQAAKNVPDILAVRDRLNAVQAEIEQLEGRRQVLDDQTSLATLAVSLREPGADKPLPRSRPHPKQSGLSQAWHRAVDGFTGGIEAIIAGSGKVLLVLLCAGALWLVAWPLWRRFRRSLV